MSLEKHEALVTRDAEEPPICPIAKLQETASVLSTETGSGTTSVAGYISESLCSGSPKRVGSLATPKKTPTSSLKADADSIGGWSDTLSVTQVSIPPPTDPISEEKTSLLKINGGGADERRPSGTLSLTPSVSPRPGSRESRRSRRSRRRTSSQRSHEPKTRGEQIMEMARGDSAKSHRRTQSGSSYRDNSVREKSSGGGSSRRQRKNSDSTTTSSISGAGKDGPGGFPGKGKRGYMTANEAVLLGDQLCGCVLKDKFLYFLKPIIFLFFGAILIAGGLVLTVLHFVFEDSLDHSSSLPYYTYGPITFSTGLILFMIGLVWVPIKQQKWKDGLASPMLAALAKWRIENLETGVIEMKDVGQPPSYAAATSLENMVTEVKEV